MHGCYFPLAVSLYPLLGCHLHELHIHRYLVHIMHKFLFSYSVPMHWVPFLFPENFIPRCSTYFSRFSLLCLVLVFSWYFVSTLPASGFSSSLYTGAYWSHVSICYVVPSSSFSMSSLLLYVASSLIVVPLWSFNSLFLWHSSSVHYAHLMSMHLTPFRCIILLQLSLPIFFNIVMVLVNVKWCFVIF